MGQTKKKLCGNVLERTPLARGDVDGWDDVRRRGVVAGRGPGSALGVAGGKCTKEIGEDGKHLDGSPSHRNPKMRAYIKTLEVHWN